MTIIRRQRRVGFLRFSGTGSASTGAVVWTSTPTPSFSALTSGSYSVSQHVANYNPATDVITRDASGAAFPPWLSLPGNGANLVADGSQAGGDSVSNVRLRATRGVSSAVSSPITVTVTGAQWASTPAPAFLNGQAGTYALGSHITNYNAGTDVFSVSPLSTAQIGPGSPNPWLTISGGNLVASGAQIDSNDFSGLRLRVTRGGATADSQPFAVSVIAPQIASQEFSVTSTANGTNVPFTCGFVFSKGAVPTGSYAVCDLAGVQVVPKNRYPDGSLKFAIVSGRIPSMTSGIASVRTLSATSTPPSGSAITLGQLQASGITATLAFTAVSGAASGTVNLHTIWSNAANLYEQHISGPAMSSWTFFSPIGGDPNHYAWFEVRYYGGSTAEIMCWLENGWATLGSVVNIEGHYVLTVQGSVRYNSADANSHWYGAVMQPAGTPFRLCARTAPVLALGNWLTHISDSTTRTWTRQNMAYLRATKQIPNYSTATSAIHYENNAAWPQSYAPNYAYVMGSDNYGPRGQYGIVSSMQLGHLVRGVEKDYRQSTYFATMMGAYSIRLRDTNTKRPIRPVDHPTLFLSEMVEPVVQHGSYQSPHGGISGYVPYLTTGWNWFCEQAQFEALFKYAESSYIDAETGFDNGRGGSRGIVQGAVRVRAWAMKKYGAAAACSPDPALAGSPASGALQEAIRTVLVNNMEWQYKSVVSGEYFNGAFVNEIGQPIPEFSDIRWSGYPDYAANLAMALGEYEYCGTPWWTNYMTMVHGFLWELDLPLTAEQKKWLRGVRDHYYRFAVNVNDGWWWRYLQSYTFPFGVGVPATIPPDFNNSSTWSNGYFRSPDGVHPGSSWFRNFDTIFAKFARDFPATPRSSEHSFANLATQRAIAGSSAPGLRMINNANTLLSGSQWLSGLYHPEKIISLAYAKDHGFPGADTIWTYLHLSPTVQEAYTHLAPSVPTLSNDQRFAAQPRTPVRLTTSALQRACLEAMPGTWTEFTPSNMSATAFFDPQPVGSIQYGAGTIGFFHDYVSHPSSDWHGRAVHDPVTRTVRWTGMGSGGGVSSESWVVVHQVVYDEATNMMSTSRRLWTNHSTNHQVYLSLINVAGRRHYRRLDGAPEPGFSVTTSTRWRVQDLDADPMNINSWSLPLIPASPSQSPGGTTVQNAGAEFWPQLGAQGSIVEINQFGTIRRYDLATQAWTNHTATSALVGSAEAMFLQPLADGGNGMLIVCRGNLATYGVKIDGSVVNFGNAPVNMSPGTTSPKLSVDPRSHYALAFVPTTRRLWTLDTRVAGAPWVNHAEIPATVAVGNTFQNTVPCYLQDYGCQLFLVPGATMKGFIYKHG